MTFHWISFDLESPCGPPRCEKCVVLRPAKVDEVLDEARRLSSEGTPVCINVLLKASDFREGSISI